MTPTLTALTGFTIIAGCFGVMVYRAKMHGKLTPAQKAELERLERIKATTEIYLERLKSIEFDLDQEIMDATLAGGENPMAHQKAFFNDCEIAQNLEYIKTLNEQIDAIKGRKPLTIWDLLK